MISKRCNDIFGKAVSFGITFWIAFQAILNLSVVVGLIPVTGVTLPYTKLWPLNFSFENKG